MTASNIAKCWWPTIMPPAVDILLENVISMSKLSEEIILDLIHNHEFYFQDVESTNC